MLHGLSLMECYTPAMKDVLGRYPIETFDEFRRAAQLYQYSRVILTAIELDLFSVLGGRTWTIRSLARRLKASQRGLEILCRNLAALGLLVKRTSAYRNSSLARIELNRHSSGYRGEYLQLIHSHWDDFARLTESVRKGTPVDAGEPDTPKWRRTFTWAMHHRSRERAQQVARTLDLRHARTLLDLGGGPGTYALAFLESNPSLRATVADRPAALAVARRIAAASHAKARVSFAPLDFMTDPLPGRYDVVWLSNIIHIYSPAKNLTLFRKIAKSLEPGGRLIVNDAFLTDSKGLYPIETTAFAVTMLLFTDTGDTYAARDVMSWLRRAGYAPVRTITGAAPTEKARRGQRGIPSEENGLIEAVLGRRNRR